MTVTLTYLGDSACEARDSASPKASPISVCFKPGVPVEMDMTNAFHRHLVDKARGNRFFQVEGDASTAWSSPVGTKEMNVAVVEVADDELAQLREEAKAAGVKSVHLFKDPAKLREKIAEAVAADE